MKQVFIKQIDSYVQKFENVRNWKRKDVDYSASMYLQFCYYTSGLFTSFTAVKICLINDCLVFRYYHAKRGAYGTAKIKLDNMMQSILLPATAAICTKHGQQITRANQYQIAA